MENNERKRLETNAGMDSSLFMMCLWWASCVPVLLTHGFGFLIRIQYSRTPCSGRETISKSPSTYPRLTFTLADSLLQEQPTYLISRSQCSGRSGRRTDPALFALKWSLAARTHTHTLTHPLFLQHPHKPWLLNAHSNSEIHTKHLHTCNYPRKHLRSHPSTRLWSFTLYTTVTPEHTDAVQSYLEKQPHYERWETWGWSWTSAEGSGCPSGPPPGTSPPSSWCSTSDSWTCTPGGLSLRIVEIKRYDLKTLKRIKMGQYSEAEWLSVCLTVRKTPSFAISVWDLTAPVCASHVLPLHSSHRDKHLFLWKINIQQCLKNPAGLLRTLTSVLNCPESSNTLPLTFRMKKYSVCTNTFLKLRLYFLIQLAGDGILYVFALFVQHKRHINAGHCYKIQINIKQHQYGQMKPVIHFWSTLYKLSKDIYHVRLTSFFGFLEIPSGQAVKLAFSNIAGYLFFRERNAYLCNTSVMLIRERHKLGLRICMLSLGCSTFLDTFQRQASQVDLTPWTARRHE